MKNITLHLHIKVTPTVTALPRILGILSRRGYILTNLRSRTLRDGAVLLECEITGPEERYLSLAGLLNKLIDVKQVDIKGKNPQ